MFFRKELTSNRSLIAYENPKSVIAEQYRNIRTNIHFSTVGQEIISLVITSADMGDGKTTTAANLATVFAQQSKKVLVIEADLRKPALGVLFGDHFKFGLTHVLSKQCEAKEAIVKTNIKNLDLIPSGPIPPNPSELLSSEIMEETLTYLKKEYQVIIFDTPPILAVTDAQLLANICDGTILVVRSKKTERIKISKSIKTLQQSKGKFLGVVLNGNAGAREEYYA